MYLSVTRRITDPYPRDQVSALQALKRTDPFIILSTVVTLFLTVSTQPWWTLTGANGSRLVSLEVSPFFLNTSATGLSTTIGFSEYLGPGTRILLVVAFVMLGLFSLNPFRWWRNIAVYFSLSTFLELYFSFFLNYHAAETLLLGAYGAIPPYSGTSILPAVVVGLDLKTYTSPSVTAGFSLPFYIGFFGLGFLSASMILKRREARKAPVQRGVEAIFTSEPDMKLEEQSSSATRV